MRRLNFTLDESTISLLEELAGALHQGNKSQTIRAALQSLSSQNSRGGWIIAGYAPAELGADAPRTAITHDPRRDMELNRGLAADRRRICPSKIPAASFSIC